MDNIQLTLESSTTTLSLNSDSIYLNPELDGLAGLPEIRTTSGVNAGYNGGWTSAQFYDARLITIRGVIANSDIATVEARRKALVGLLGQGRKEELTLHFVTAGGQSYVLNCRTISCEMALSGLATKQEFLIQLRADDPLIYDDGTLATEAIVNVRRALGGFQIDFGLPLYIGGGVNETLVENGNETVYPVINLYGPLHSPTIINQTTNQQMQVLTDLDYTLTWVNPVEVTGDYILVTNETDKESPLSSVEMLGNTTQNTLSGKNVLNYGAYINSSASGITISYDSYTGLLTTSGQASSQYPALTGQFMMAETIPSGTQLTLSLTKNLPSNVKLHFRVYATADATTYYGVQIPEGGKSVTFTLSTNLAKTMLIFQTAVGSSINLSSVGLMLEESASATDFEPYCDGVPAPNPTWPIAVQTTTGEQEVVITGKNLFNMNAVIPAGTTTTLVSVNAIFDTEQSLTLNGSATSNNVLFWGGSHEAKIYVDPNTTYYAYIKVLSGSISTLGNVQLAYECRYNGGTRVYYRSTSLTGNSQLIQLDTSGAEYITRLRFYATSFPTYANWRIQIGIYTESYSDFVPYQGQIREINLGKNLFDKDNAEIVHTYTTSGHTVTNSNAWSIILPCEPNAFYTYSNTNPTAMKNDSSINFYATKPTEADIAKIGSQVNLNQNATVTFTTPAGANWMLLYYRWNASDESSAYAGMMIERGSKATTYAPYFTPIELCKLGTYRDYIYKSGDDWFVHEEVGKVVFDGSADESWTIGQSSGYYRGYIDVANSITTAIRRDMWSDHFHYKSNGHEVGTGFTYGGQFFAYPEQTITTASALKTWLASNPTKLYYFLATPTDTQITNQALIDQLEALASSTLFVGVNNITLAPSSGAQGELSIDYFSAYTEDRDIVVIDSQARTITKNGADIYYLKADGSEFPTLAPGENTLYLTSEQTSDEGYAEIKFKQGYLSI